MKDVLPQIGICLVSAVISTAVVLGLAYGAGWLR